MNSSIESISGVLRLRPLLAHCDGSHFDDGLRFRGEADIEQFSARDKL
jgi:hypothetical protein